MNSNHPGSENYNRAIASRKLILLNKVARRILRVDAFGVSRGMADCSIFLLKLEQLRKEATQFQEKSGMTFARKQR